MSCSSAGNIELMAEGTVCLPVLYEYYSHQLYHRDISEHFAAFREPKSEGEKKEKGKKKQFEAPETGLFFPHVRRRVMGQFY
jgi:hypothetical protein